MKKIMLISLALLALAGCKVATLSDQYGPLVISENGSFKDQEAKEEYSIEYATPQSIASTNSPLARLGIPTEQISAITVKREIRSSSQGGTIFSAISEALINTAKLAAGVF